MGHRLLHHAIYREGDLGDEPKRQLELRRHMETGEEQTNRSRSFEERDLGFQQFRFRTTPSCRNARSDCRCLAAGQAWRSSPE